MNQPSLTRTVVRLVAIVACCAGQSGCGGSNAGGDATVNLTTRALPSDTTATLFVLKGTGVAGTGISAYGDFTTDFTGSLAQVPEGYKWLDCYGVKKHSTESPNPAGFSSSIWSVTSSGAKAFYVNGGTTQNIEVTVQARGSDHLGVSKRVISGNYRFDALAKYAGSPSGISYTVVCIDAADSAADITLTATIPDYFILTDRHDVSGFFATLPDPDSDPGAGKWPDPDTWATTIDLTTDAKGDAFCYLVARPGEAGHVVQITASGAGFTDTQYAIVRLATLNQLTAGPDVN